MRGRKAGAESVQSMLESFSSGKAVPFNALLGAFHCIVRFQDELIFFTDNSWMRAFYFADHHMVCDGFIEMAKSLPKLTLNAEALAEFLTLGKYLTRLPFGEISATEAHLYYSVKRGIVTAYDKGVGAIEHPSPLKHQQDVMAFFRDMSDSFQDLSVFHDLSGGYDSRMSISLLKNAGTKMTIGLSSYEPESDMEVKIGRKVARRLDEEFLVCQADNMLEDDGLVYQLFLLTDGIQQISCKDLNRISQYLNFCVHLGADVRFAGDGGVFYKDWDWSHEFPFYNKKTSNIPRYYKLKIGTVRTRARFYSESMSSLIKSVPGHLISVLMPLMDKTNTRTYDRLYAYRSNVMASRIYTAFSKVVPIYTPLRELPMTQYAFVLPRSRRFYNNFQRDLISQCTPQISRIRTLEGTNCSSRFFDKAFDSVFWLKGWSEKAYRVLSRRLVGRNSLAPQSKKRYLEPSAALVADSLKFARKAGLLKKGKADDEFPPDVSMRLLWFYLLAKDLPIDELGGMN